MHHAPEMSASPRPLLLLGGIGLSLAIVVATGLHLDTRHADATERLTIRAQQVALAFEEHVERFVEKHEIILRIAAQRYQHDPAGFDIREPLGPGIALPDSVVQFALIGPDGRLLGSNLAPATASQPLDLSDREHFIVHRDHATSGLFVSRPVFGRISQQWSIQFTRRLDNTDGSFAGVVVLSVDPFKLAGFFDKIDLGKDGVVLLAGTDGIIRARTGMVAGETSILANARVSKQLLDAATAAPAGTYSATCPIDGVERVAAFRIPPQRALIVFAGIGLQEGMRGFWSYAYALFGMTTAVIAAIWLVVFSTLRAIRIQATTVALETAARRARSELDMLDSIVGTAPAAMVVLDEDGCIVRANPRFYAIFSRGAADGNWHASFRAFLERNRILVQGVKGAGGGPLEFIDESWGAGALDHAVSWAFCQLPKQPTAGSQFVGIGVDTTENRKIERDLQHKSGLLSLGEMATGMAHELNQPLNVIRLASEHLLLRSENGTADAAFVRAKIARIVAQTDRASGLIDHMRIYGRRPSGCPQPCSIADVIAGASTLVEAPLAAAGIQLECSIAPGLPPVSGHSTLLEQVIVNLTLNAKDAIIGHRPAGGGRIRISAGLAPGGETIQLEVFDNGGGIPPDLMKRIFEPFFTTKPPGQGTGLGLAMSYGIVTDLGGGISVRNISDGAVFLVTLPILPRASGVVHTDIPVAESTVL